jgi:hypothetical protein
LDQASSFARKYLIANGIPCGRHCNDPVKFVSLYDGERGLIGAYVCPQRYVSKVVYFSDNPDGQWFERYISDQAGAQRVRRKDIRFATRHGWELGRDAEKEIQNMGLHGIKQYYWTFYPKSDEDSKFGTFLCPRESGGCGKLFTKSMDEEDTLCLDCSK